MSRAHPLRRLAAACAALLLAPTASAQPNQWQGPATGDWDDPASWSQGSSPGPGHYVLITPDAGADVTGPAAPTAIELLGLNAMVSGTASLALQPGGDLSIAQKLMIGPRGRLAIDAAVASAAETILAGRLVLADGSTVESASQLLNFGRIDAEPDAVARLAGGPVFNLGTVRSNGGFQTRLVVDDDFVNAGTLLVPFTEIEIGGDFINVAPIASCSFTTIRAAGLLANASDEVSLDQFCQWRAPIVYNTGDIGDGVWIEASTVVNEGTIRLSQLDGGTIVADTVINDGSIVLVEHTDASADIDVRETGSLYVAESSSVAGRITVAGWLTTGTASLENVVFTATGRYGAAPDDDTTVTLSITGDLINESASPDGFVIGQFVERFTLHVGGGTGSHVFRHPGADLGPVEAGYVENFAWPGLRLTAGDQLVIEDGNATPGVGLYVRRLELQGGLAQIASITGNGANVYYDPDEAANAYLAGQTYPLGGGGAIVPVE